MKKTRVVIPTDGKTGRVFQTFVRAPAFAVVDVDGDGTVNVTVEFNPASNASRMAGVEAVRFVQSVGADIVAAPNIGSNAADNLAAFGIRFVLVPVGTPIEKAAKNAVNGGTPISNYKPLGYTCMRGRFGRYGRGRNTFTGRGNGLGRGRSRRGNGGRGRSMGRDRNKRIERDNVIGVGRWRGYGKNKRRD